VIFIAVGPRDDLLGHRELMSPRNTCLTCWLALDT
jgi:hypothetical protein